MDLRGFNIKDYDLSTLREIIIDNDQLIENIELIKELLDNDVVVYVDDVRISRDDLDE